LPGVVAARDTIMAQREKLGLYGPYAVWAQVVPPATVEAAREVAKDYRAAGIDGIILSESRAREPGFPAEDAASQALIETAAA